MLALNLYMTFFDLSCICQKSEAKSEGASPKTDIHRQLLSTQCFILFSPHTCTSNKHYKHMLIPLCRVKATITFPYLRKRKVFSSTATQWWIIKLLRKQVFKSHIFLPTLLHVLSPILNQLYNHAPSVDCPSKKDFPSSAFLKNYDFYNTISELNFIMIVVIVFILDFHLRLDYEVL